MVWLRALPVRPASKHSFWVSRALSGSWPATVRHAGALTITVAVRTGDARSLRFEDGLASRTCCRQTLHLRYICVVRHVRLHPRTTHEPHAVAGLLRQLRVVWQRIADANALARALPVRTEIRDLTICTRRACRPGSGALVEEALTIEDATGRVENQQRRGRRDDPEPVADNEMRHDP